MMGQPCYLTNRLIRLTDLQVMSCFDDVDAVYYCLLIVRSVSSSAKSRFALDSDYFILFRRVLLAQC